jgi:hypothetical protein
LRFRSRLRLTIFRRRTVFYYETWANGFRVLGNCHLHVGAGYPIFTADNAGCSHTGFYNPHFIGPGEYQVTQTNFPAAVIYIDRFGEVFDLIQMIFQLGQSGMTVRSSSGHIFDIPTPTDAQSQIDPFVSAFDWTGITWLLFRGPVIGLPGSSGITSLTVDVPEPSLPGLLVIGLLGAAFGRRLTIQREQGSSEQRNIPACRESATTP